MVRVIASRVRSRRASRVVDVVRNSVFDEGVDGDDE